MNNVSVSVENEPDAFSKDRAALLKLLLERESTQAQKITPYPRSDGTDASRLPASRGQQRLWFIDQLEAGAAGYNSSMGLRLQGALDQEALRKALDTLVQRHEVLRTVFVSVDGDPRQEIAPEGRFALQLIDLSGYEEAERVAQVRLHESEESNGKFDLRVGPLIRGRLLRVQAEEHVLLITLHHIVSDGWSRGVLLRELGELYGAYREGRDDPLEPLPIQYVDYAQWQREWLQGEEMEKQLSYWRVRLEGAALQLELPTDRPRPAVQSYRGENVGVVLDAQLSAKLRAFAQRHELTLFMALYAPWAMLLSRLSGQDDVVIGTAIAGRQRPELEGLIGFFVNTLVLRVAVRGDLRMEEFLERIKEVTLGAYDHQDVPFEQLVEALQPQRSLSRNPLFQVSFSLQNVPTSDQRLPGLTVTLEDGLNEPAIFDLFLSLEERGDEIIGSVNYAADLFDRETVERWMVCFTVLLRGMTDGVWSRIGDLPMMPESERHQVIERFNATRAAYPQEKLIHELFEEQVKRTPAAVAVVYAGQSLTYAELNGRANQLARYLRERGVGADQLVGICVERSLEMVVGLLGTLKAGGAYVPLDPHYPTERLAYMLDDAAPKVLLTQQRFRERVPDTAAEVIALDSEWSEMAERDDEDLDPRALQLTSRHLAYAIYTSGSTGNPKGVMIEHRNVVNLWKGLEHVYSPLISCQRIALNASFNFDASVQQLVQLLSGFTIVVVPQESRRDASMLLSFMDENQIDGIDCTPSQLKAWIAAGLVKTNGRQLRVVLVGGEAIDEELWSRLAQCDEVDFYNVYGPTECTVDATIAYLKHDMALPHIGHPMINRRIYVLDRLGHPVPLGAVGEIYIGGAGVARGYLNRPELTTERFLSDPFSADPQARMYKTGDLGRWRADGNIEYLGRNDHQVKIRGFRMELGEIEAQLVRHPQVKEAVVLAREDAPGEKRLVAYIVADRNVAVEADSGGASELLREAVGEWQAIHEETYGTQNQTVAPSFVGWNSSYTGERIPEDEMHEWLTYTVERIKALRPQKMLEIGCGAGLLLQHLAPQCSVYVGADFSASVLAQLRQWMSGREDLQHVELLHRSATELLDVPSGSFDTIVLNSVVQYFPDIGYLRTVLQEAVRLLGPGGRIFIGDVRHLGLLSMFHSAVQLSKASATVSVGQLRKRIARAVAQEKELAIDPQFFQVLPGRVPGISAVEIQLKRGRASNELTCYRYDVVLHTDEQMGTRAVCEPLEWPTAVGSAAKFEAALRERRWCAARLSSIPNGRLTRDATAQRLIETSDERLEAGVLRRQLNELQWEQVGPEQFWKWGEEHGYEVQVSWSTPDSLDCVEVQLLDRARANQVPRVPLQPPKTVRPWSAYANDPLENSFRQQLIPQLRDYLKGRLPDYMIPSAWMALKQLPLTPNGKLDRRALPVPQSRPEELGEYIAPRTELERTLASIWAQVLRVDQVGVQDNFFELGGHSLLAMQVIARIGSSLSVEMPVRLLFEFPTIKQLLAPLDDLRQARLLDEIAVGGTDIQELLERVASMPESKVQEWVREMGMEKRS